MIKIIFIMDWLCFMSIMNQSHFPNSVKGKPRCEQSYLPMHVSCTDKIISFKSADFKLSSKSLPEVQRTACWPCLCILGKEHWLGTRWTIFVARNFNPLTVWWSIIVSPVFKHATKARLMVKCYIHWVF